MRRPKADVWLSCGHHVRRASVATPDSELLQCPWCGEFGTVTTQILLPKSLKSVPGSDNMSLFDDVASESIPPPF